MPATNETARLKRVIEELIEAVATDTRRSAMKPSDRRTLRSDIESAIRALDELRTRLAG